MYYVVGTALVVPNEREPRSGRILIFQVSSSKPIDLHIVIWLAFLQFANLNMSIANLMFVIR